MGVGIALLHFSVTSTCINDTLAHTRNETHTCGYIQIFSNKNLFSSSVLLPSNFSVTCQLCLSSKLSMDIFVPHSMKGLFIGLSFAFSSLFELVASLPVLPFMFSRLSLPSCGMECFMVTIIVGVVGVAVYVCVARNKLSERDE